MSYIIQPDFDCRNCVKCGRRPVIDQVKKVFKIKCPNKSCNNVVSGSMLNFEKWNIKNSPAASNRKEGNGPFKRIA
ncbi:hypothetical protein [Mucilaginibacter arboris]|uniref:Uncharacterized protein n=1 Tax=Mucilaginibacter arboris TaxID=2682090 RepID=A0A7K1T038_9SPHI|nr:hypothetical protein [Mucilaginibacter arboris]MVN22934.1 hypothetical protein [Mucilaginibacter arboris]